MFTSRLLQHNIFWLTGTPAPDFRLFFLKFQFQSLIKLFSHGSEEFYTQHHPTSFTLDEIVTDARMLSRMAANAGAGFDYDTWLASDAGF